ncbi:MAG: sulfatase-like hydrolase/transferase, partial [Verrucomicrobia bacterium]|nr:sulfatase-like hydrolase/transferase [Verrucomicrobiota bacterium]
MNHRNTICLVALLLAPLAPLHAAEARRPNVLFIIVDDLTTTLGCYGDRDARTPHMDALAARGVRFSRAYTQFALCNPSRCSFLTGCYPERTRVFDLTTSLRKALPDVVTLPQLFKNAGYTAGRIGKVFHVGDPKT